MNKKSVSIFLALITATTALLTGCGGNLPGIASVTEVQGVNSSEAVSSKEASESSKSSTSSVSSKDETTTNKDTPSTPEEKKEFDGSYQKNEVVCMRDFAKVIITEKAPIFCVADTFGFMRERL